MREPTQEITDHWLIIRSQGGDVAAFELLVARWQRRLLGHARRLTQDDAASWDVVQESWMSILRGFRRLKDPAAFPTWAFRIVTCKSIDHMRAREKQRQVAEPAVRQPTVKAPDEEDDDVVILRAAIKAMPVPQRAILTLYYREEFGLQRIGEILGIPVGTVKSRLHHARIALKKAIERRQK